MDCLLRFLYVGTVDYNKSFPKLNTLLAIFKVLKLADFFCLPRLEALALQALEDTSRSTARFLCAPSKFERHFFGRRFDSTIDDEILPSIRGLYEQDDGLAAAAAAVREKVLDAVLGLVAASMHHLQPREDFRRLFREIPAFAADWATATVAGSTHAKLPALSDASYNCRDCGSVVPRAAVAVDGLAWFKYSWREVEFLCAECFETPSIHVLVCDRKLAHPDGSWGYKEELIRLRNTE